MSLVPGSIMAGEPVEIYAFRRWRVGLVLHVTEKRVEVRYSTPHGAKTTRDTWFNYDSAQIRRSAR